MCRLWKLGRRAVYDFLLGTSIMLGIRTPIKKKKKHYLITNNVICLVLEAYSSIIFFNLISIYLIFVILILR